MGGAMSENRNFTLTECLMVVAILLFVSALAIQNLVHSVKTSEEYTVHTAATQYSAVRNMFAEQPRAVPAGASGVNSTSAASILTTPVR
jgi:type II secretory pathway pseudopilin PulG